MEHLYTLQQDEYTKNQMKQDFEPIRKTMQDLMYWTLPYRSRALFNRTGQNLAPRNNQHIVDPTHILALRSYVAGFLEGNTSTSRPWFRLDHPDPLMRRIPKTREWIDKLTRRSLEIGTSSNLYHALAEAYYDYGAVNTATFWISELPTGPHFTVLEPGSHYMTNNFIGIANCLVREFPMNVKALVEEYGIKKDGKYDWSNFSPRVKTLYERGDYNTIIDVCAYTEENKYFNPNNTNTKENRRWVTRTYETSITSGGTGYSQEILGGYGLKMPDGSDKYLRIGYHTRKPFLSFRSTTTRNSAYGEKGPTYDALGIIRSLNKKAINKDIALNQMVSPTTQGPASLRKNYITNVPNAHIPLDPTSAALGGVKRVFEINPAIQALIQDTGDLQNVVNKIYYQDFLLFLTQNPKTRTAAEVNAVQSEQQLVIGPNLQSLNWTLNKPLVEYLVEYAIYEDPYLEAPPQDLAGESLEPVFISLFAQSQKSADIPSIEKYVRMIAELSPINAEIMDKLDVDVLADLVDDRLYLPPGLNRSKGDVDAIREKRQHDMAKQQQLNETIPALAGAAKDMGLNKQQ